MLQAEFYWKQAARRSSLGVTSHRGTCMSKNYAVKDRDGTIHTESSRKDALRSQKAYGGMVVEAKPGSRKGWKTYKPHKVFLWIFLAVQVGFLIWTITAATGNT